MVGRDLSIAARLLTEKPDLGISLGEMVYNAAETYLAWAFERRRRDVDALEAMHKRRNVRDYTGDPIPRTDLEKIVDAGRMAARRSTLLGEIRIEVAKNYYGKNLSS